MIDLQKLREEYEKTWPPIIARDDIATYTGGLYSTGTMQVYDSKGIGVKNPVRLQGRKIGYPKQDLIDWLLSRMEAADAKSAE